jgi:hypothetical protein
MKKKPGCWKSPNILEDEERLLKKRGFSMIKYEPIYILSEPYSMNNEVHLLFAV